MASFGLFEVVPSLPLFCCSAAEPAERRTRFQLNRIECHCVKSASASPSPSSGSHSLKQTEAAGAAAGADPLTTTMSWLDIVVVKWPSGQNQWPI